MNKIWNLDCFKNNIAAIDEFGNQITYGVLNKNADELAQTIGNRCLVFSLCRNEIGSILGYVSFLNNGIVPVMLNSHLDEELLNDLLKIYKPKYLWAPKDQVEQFIGCSIVCEKYNYVLVKTNFDKEYPLYPDLALLLTTSGSTGSPKFVRQSYVNVLDNAESIVKYLKHLAPCKFSCQIVTK